MKFKTFWKSISALILALLLIMAFLRGPESQRLMVGVFGLWGAFIAVMLLKTLLIKTGSGIGSLLLRTTQSGKAGQANDISQLTIENRELRISFTNQIIHRITENLQSCYPDAEWKWAEKNPLERLLDQEPCRIKISNVKDFNFADIQIGTKGELYLDFGKLVTLDEIKQKAKEEKDAPEAVKADESWFHTEGNKILNNLLCELNAAGYSQFFISKNGEISVIDEGKPQVLESDFHMPDISLIQLKDLLKSINLKSNIDGDMLAVSI